MKKTSKSPNNMEVTPNKKKLKQARLPFMILSEVSPKAESTQPRKRKLSAPDAAPVTKVGKLSKENSITEDSVVVSDDDSKDLPSPKKQEKLPNPYVKLVDSARKKKLQKATGQKKSKSKSKKQVNRDSERETQQNSHDSEDVEMMEVEAVVHQEDDKEPDTKTGLQNRNSEAFQNNSNTKETNNNKKTKNSANSTPIDSPKNKPKGITLKFPKETKKSENCEVVCIDDSNNSDDVRIPTPNNTDKETTAIEKKDKTEKNPPQKPIEKPKASLANNRKKTPKRSMRNKVFQEESKEQEANGSEDQEKEKKESVEKSNEIVKYSKAENSAKADSDIEMVDLGEEQEICENNKSDKSPKTNEKEETSKDTNSKPITEDPVTPKRSTRIKTKDESSLDKSTCSKLDESIASNPSTPSYADKSLNESLKNLTPKQLAKKVEAAKKREEREKERLEREKKRQEEKEERAKQRQEKEEAKKREREEKEEAKRKEREEKEEQRKKEKEEKEKQRELEKKLKEEKEEAKRKEREEKEEQRKKEKEAREEERRKKQEALELEKQEQELKLKKTKEAFVSFFVPKQKVDKEPSSENGPVSKSSMLSSFTVKIDMRLAPTVRNELDDERRDTLDKYLKEQDTSGDLYLKCLRDGMVKPGSSGKTWPLSDKDDDDVMVVEDELPPIDGAGEVITCESAPREKLRPKLLSFHENRRPPYWGTWRKKSEFVKPRRPFGQEKQLDYEVDSDDDWEDEADGESLDGSAGGSEDEGGADDYDIDNEVFVPHGYLSDEEATMDDEGDDVLSLSPETQKARLKHLEDEFESELKKPTEKLKPRLYGLLWETPEGGKPEKCVDALWNYFEKFAMIMNDVTPLLQPAPEPEKETEKKKIKKKKIQDGELNEQSPKSKKKKEAKTENKEKKPKQEAKKSLPNQPGINSFLKKVNTT